MNSFSARLHIRQLLGWLGDREQQLQLALEAADLATWHWNPDLGEAVWSDRCRQLIGVGPEVRATFDNFMNCVHRDDRARLAAAVDVALRTGGAYSEEYRVVLADGAVRWLHSMGRAQLSASRVVQRMSGVLRDVTETKLNVEALNRERETFQQLVKASPIGTAKFDRNMCYLAANQSLIDFLRLDGNNLIGRCHYDLLPGLPERWRVLHRRALGGESLSGTGDRFVHADGTADDVSWRVFPWLEGDGKVGGIVLMVEVLTAKRRMQDEGLLWASAFRHCGSAMAIVDPATCSVRSANAAYGRLLGYEPQQLAGRSVFTLYPEHMHLRLREAVQRADAEGSSTTEIVRLHSSGDLLPTQLNLVSVRDESGALSYRISTVTDISERERDQAKLRQQEALRLVDQRFRLLAESAPVGILLQDEAGTTTYANAAWLGMTAMSLGEALERNWLDIVHADDRERVRVAWKRLLSGATFDAEFRYVRPSGEARWVQAHASPITDASGSRLGYVRVCLDVTDRLLERAATDQFHSQLRSLAQRLQELREVERNEVAASLQQEVFGGLYELKDGIERLSKTVADGSDASHAKLAMLAGTTLDGLRRVLFDLTPPGIGELGFALALERYAGEQSARSGVNISLSLPDQPLPAQQELLVVMYAVAQQGIANAIEHASASQVSVSFAVTDRIARLRVSDNGVGIRDQDRGKPGCFGLLAASERLGRVGGTLRVLGIAGSGTRFEATAPATPLRERDGR